MKRLFFIVILLAAVVINVQQTAQAGFISEYKAKIAKNRMLEDSVKEVRNVFALQDTYTNKYNYDKLYELYSDDFINSDGYDKKVYFKLIKETWETYPEITYITKIKSINVSSNYATVETKEIAYAVTEESNEQITAVGELHSEANCVYHLKKRNGKWLIHAEDIIEERSALKFGDARFVKMELNAPTLVSAGGEYAAELKVDMPEDQIVIASISKENIIQPVEKAAEKYRRLPPEQILERIFTANSNNVNEYNIAAVGLTESEPVDDENVKVYMNGLAFLMTRVNVVPKNNFVKLEEIESGKTK